MSFGELSGLPSNLSSSTVTVPSYSVRVMRRVVLAGDEPALAVAGIPVRMIGRLAKNADSAGLLLPFHDAVVGDVAPQQVAAVAEPHRPLGPAHAYREPFDARQQEAVLGEARIERLHGRIRIAL